MTEISVKVDVPQLDGVAARLSSQARQGLALVVANEIKETVREHLFSYAPTHHRTAALLGARPTGNLEDATVEARTDGEGAVVEVGAMGIRRALVPLTIRPRNKHWLTIPKHPLAYGRSVANLKSDDGIDVFRPRGKNYLAFRENGDSKFATVLYVLAKRAVLKHEPELLPTAAELSAAGAAAARQYIFGG